MSLIKKEFFPPFHKDKGLEPEYMISAETKFDAAHRLSNYIGKCRKIHGHTYRVIITIQSGKLNTWGAVIDFKDLKELLKKHIDDKYDHRLILKSEDIQNKVISKILEEDWIVWMESNPTAENMARDIYKDLAPAIRNKFESVELVSVIVYETATNKAVYQEHEG